MVPTPHLVRHDGTTLYACCAIDALAVPGMIDAAVTVESRCADCDTVIRVEMTGDRILASHPDAPVVFHVSRDCCEAGPTILTRCPHINFFCGLDHARRWQAAHPGRVGDTLRLSQAVARAREIFASTIRLVREDGAGGEGGAPPRSRSR